MPQADVIAFNAAAFSSALFLLEFGADKFIDHTAVVARRTGLPETVVGLLTAGGEWEELAVVVASLVRGRSSLAVGNVIGAAISNILGAFSLGLLSFDKGRPVHFDRSARIYSLVLLVLTTLAIPAVYFPTRVVWGVCGPVLITAFAVYLVSVGVAIGRGVLTAPEDSDSDSDSGSEDGNKDDESQGQMDENSDSPTAGDDHEEHPAAANTAGRVMITPTEADPLLSPVVPFASPDSLTEDAPRSVPTTRRRRQSLKYHLLYLFFGFLAICLAGYVLSQAATNITDQLGASDVLFGVVALAIATTLPEKFVAVVSSRRGHPGILVANCVGSNIFLLTLCIGIAMADTKGALDDGNVTVPELVTLWVSTLSLTLTVWFGAKFCRCIGMIMLTGYIAFIVLEVTVIHGVAD